jgi:hypothetical protein
MFALRELPSRPRQSRLHLVSGAVLAYDAPLALDGMLARQRSLVRQCALARRCDCVGLWRAHPASAEVFYVYGATRVAGS